ncbi:hypothetical protein Tco_0934932 [Tanacetum coccineum]
MNDYGNDLDDDSHPVVFIHCKCGVDNVGKANTKTHVSVKSHQKDEWAAAVFAKGSETAIQGVLLLASMLSYQRTMGMILMMIAIQWCLSIANAEVDNVGKANTKTMNGQQHGCKRRQEDGNTGSTIAASMLSYQRFDGGGGGSFGDEAVVDYGNDLDDDSHQ